MLIEGENPGAVSCTLAVLLLSIPPALDLGFFELSVIYTQ